VRLILSKVYAFEYETWWLKNERRNMIKEFIVIPNNLFEELLKNTGMNESSVGHIPSFLDQYRHEIGPYYTDTYDCSYYCGKGNNICECGDCGGTIYTIWCEYKNWKEQWYIDSHMESDGRKTALEISNLYFDDFTRYNESLERKRIILCKRKT